MVATSDIDHVDGVREPDWFLFFEAVNVRVFFWQFCHFLDSNNGCIENRDHRHRSIPWYLGQSSKNEAFSEGVARIDERGIVLFVSPLHTPAGAFAWNNFMEKGMRWRNTR